MASNNNFGAYDEIGIIILGNVGAGKSYIGNLLLGENRFETGFEPDVVTTVTKQEPVMCFEQKYHVYNVPGLIEANEESIERNKCEIYKAFQMCERSIIIFVWRETGGRAQSDDIIAFNALNSAIEFAPESLMFIVNNVPSNREPEYDAKFIVLLSKLLKSSKVSMENTFFLENMRSIKPDVIKSKRDAIWSRLSQMKPSTHKKQIVIVLQLDQLKELKAVLKRQEEEAERDKQGLERKLEKIDNEMQVDSTNSQQDVAEVSNILNRKQQELQRDRHCGSQQRSILSYMREMVQNVMDRNSFQSNTPSILQANIQKHIEAARCEYMVQLTIAENQFYESVKKANDCYKEKLCRLIPHIAICGLKQEVESLANEFVVSSTKNSHDSYLDPDI